MNPSAVILLEPVLPWWLVTGCGIVFAWLAWRTYRSCALKPRERLLLWSLRLAAFLLTVWIMALASSRIVRTETEPAVVAVLTDLSASMEDNPLEASQTRAQRALDFIRSSTFRRATRDCRVLYFGMGAELEENASPDNMAFTAPKSLLTPALLKTASRLRAENLAAVIVLSDGLDQSGQSLDALALPAPALIPELEDPGAPDRQATLDFTVADLAYPKRVIVGWKTTVAASIQRRSGSAAQTFPVQLRQGGQVISTESAAFAEGESFLKISFSLEPVDIGSQLYEILINPELDSDNANNRRELIIEVTDAKQRILYLEGTPRWEFKFLKRSLLAEKNMQLNAFVRAGDGAFINFDEQAGGGLGGGALPPLTAEHLRQFKAVILGDLPGSAFSPDDASEIRQFVEKGGGLLFLGARTAYGAEGLAGNEPIRQLLPVRSEPGATMREGRFSVDFTPAGRNLPVFTALAEEIRLPPLLSIWGPVQTGDFATTFLSATDGSPILVGRRYGQGRVAMVLSESLWRWQMGSNADETGKGFYGRFVTQLLHWLSPSQEDGSNEDLLQVLLASPEVDLREQIVIGALGGKTTAAGGLTCRLQAPSGKNYTLPMLPARLETEVGLNRPQDGFRCDFVPDETGPYQVEVITPDGAQQAATVLLVRFPEHERTGQTINRPFLRQLAEATGGQYVSWRGRDELLAALRPEPRQLETVSEKPLWNHWLGLAALMTLFCLEWWLRRRWDLV